MPSGTKGTKRISGTGHTIQILGDPIPARKLKVGMQVHYSGAMCRVARIENPAHPDAAHLVLVTLDRHPVRDSFTTAVRHEDVWHRSIVEESVEDADPRDSGWRTSDTPAQPLEDFLEGPSLQEKADAVLRVANVRDRANARVAGAKVRGETHVDLTDLVTEGVEAVQAYQELKPRKGMRLRRA